MSSTHGACGTAEAYDAGSGVAAEAAAAVTHLHIEGDEAPSQRAGLQSRVSLKAEGWHI